MVVQRLVLLLLAVEKSVADDEAVDFGRHEAAIGVLDGVDNRLATDVERSVDHHAATGLIAKSLEHAVQEWIALGIDCLHAGRVIDVRDRWDIGARYLEGFDAELAVDHGRATALAAHR